MESLPVIYTLPHCMYGLAEVDCGMHSLYPFILDWMFCCRIAWDNELHVMLRKVVSYQSGIDDSYM